MNNLSADSVLDRLQLAAGVKSDSALARTLDVNRATLGNWRNRNSVPYSFCVCFSVKNHISLNWLLAGQGHMTYDEAEPSSASLKEDHLRLIELFDALSEGQQQDVLQLVAEKKRLNDLEKAVQDLQRTINPSIT